MIAIHTSIATSYLDVVNGFINAQLESQIPLHFRTQTVHKQLANAISLVRLLRKMSAQMGNFDIKDGEYTKTIYTMIKEQRYKLFLKINLTCHSKEFEKKKHFTYAVPFSTLSRYTDAIQILSYIYDTHPTSRAALSLLAYCYFYTQVSWTFNYRLFNFRILCLSHLALGLGIRVQPPRWSRVKVRFTWLKVEYSQL